MANFLTRLFTKQSPSQTAISMQRLGQPVTTQANYAGFSQEGYQKNVIAFRAIYGIASACADMPILLYKRRDGGKPIEVHKHEILKLLSRPNPMAGQSTFFERAVAFFLLTGNLYIEATSPTPGAKPLELWVPRPDRMKIIPGAIGLPSSYIYKVGSKEIAYPVDQIRGYSPILHMKSFNPTDDWYGMSPLEAASLSVDNHNSSSKHNLALFQNGAQPSGALVVKTDAGNPSGSLTDEQYNKLDQKLAEKFTGVSNRGRPMILEGGLDWREMGLSPKDMDYIQGKNVSAREIALAFGYPPVLLGIQGDATYNNQKEAKLALYEETAIPLMNRLLTELNRWLIPMFGDLDLFLAINKDEVDALAPKREAKWTQVQSASFLTINEKREALGYSPKPGGDTIFVGVSDIPLDMANDKGGGDEGDSSSSGSDDNGGSDTDGDGDDADPDPGSTDETAEAEAAKSQKALSQKASETRFADFVNRYVERVVGDKVTGIQKTSKKRVTEAIRAAVRSHLDEGSNLNELTDSIQENVSQVYETMSTTRARTIARTETSIASNEGSRAAAESLGIPNLVKEWNSADDERTRGANPDDQTDHQKMHGVQVPLHEKFSVPSMDGEDQMDGPGDPTAPADQIINCRCVLTYEQAAGKSFNLGSVAAKRKHVLSINKRRASFERAFANHLKVSFESEAAKLLSALKDVNDAQTAETIVDRTIAGSTSDLKRIVRANLEAIMKEFGKDVLSLG